MSPSTFTPYLVYAARARYPNEVGAFAYGTNVFATSYSDTVSPELPEMSYEVNIPTWVSLDEVLLLYVYRNAVVLMTENGVVLSDQTLAQPDDERDLRNRRSSEYLTGATS